MRVLLALEEGQKNITELIAIVTKSGVGQRAMYTAIDVLEETGFIQEVEVKHRARIYNLTDTGKEALELLRKMIELFN